MSGLEYVFVHDLSGWGSYDEAYQKRTYWGMRGGDLMVSLRENGYNCYAASVAPAGSAWDRACELYAQLAGTKVDYGEAHSRACHHERFGRDFSGCPLIPSWQEDTRLVLLGHSFGGTTVRLFSELLANGDAEERQATTPEKLSPLFTGGMGSRIHAIVTLASPMNGSTAYDMSKDPNFDPESVKVPLWSRMLSRIMRKRIRAKAAGLDARDNANYDMYLDRAQEINERITTLPHVFYFSVPCSATKQHPDGTFLPVQGIEPLLVARSRQIGAYTGRTAGGMIVDETWLENDGLVNTISAMAPSGAPSGPLDRENIKPGLWNVFPTVQGDHMWLQGGLLRKHDIRSFYLDLLTMISSLPLGEKQA